MIHDPFKVYQLNKGHFYRNNWQLVDGEKSPGSAFILRYLFASVHIFLSRKKMFPNNKVSYHCKYWIPWKEPAEELLIKIGSHWKETWTIELNEIQYQPTLYVFGKIWHSIKSCQWQNIIIWHERTIKDEQ